MREDTQKCTKLDSRMNNANWIFYRCVLTKPSDLLHKVWYAVTIVVAALPAVTVDSISNVIIRFLYLLNNLTCWRLSTAPERPETPTTPSGELVDDNEYIPEGERS